MNALPAVNNAKIKGEIEAKLSAALRRISKYAPANPEVASKVIQSVGEAGAKNQLPNVANEAVTSLENLSAAHPAEFSSFHRQLKTNIASTVSARYQMHWGAFRHAVDRQQRSDYTNTHAT